MFAFMLGAWGSLGERQAPAYVASWRTTLTLHAMQMRWPATAPDGHPAGNSLNLSHQACRLRNVCGHHRLSHDEARRGRVLGSTQ
jgi:hypothetical protein